MKAEYILTKELSNIDHTIYVANFECWFQCQLLVFGHSTQIALLYISAHLLLFMLLTLKERRAEFST